MKIQFLKVYFQVECFNPKEKSRFHSSGTLPVESHLRSPRQPHPRVLSTFFKKSISGQD